MQTEPALASTSALPAEDAVVERYFERLYETFAAAQERCEPVDRYYRIGPIVVRLRFAGAALVPVLTPALAHLGIDPTSLPHVTVCLFDQASTGTMPPARMWALSAHGARGEIQGFNTSRYRAVYDAAERALCMADLDRHLAVFCVRDAGAVPYYERGAPLRSILHWLLGRHERQLVHAAAVGTPRGGALLAGRSGSGKSTAALACIGSPLGYAGDDYVVVDRESPPRVHSLYSTAKVHAEQLDRLPHIRALVDNAAHLASEKALIFLHRHLPDRLSKGFPVRVLLLPRITGERETRLVPASPAAALGALAPTTVFQLPGGAHRTFATLSSLVRRVPSYWLDAGTDITRIPEAIAEAVGP